MDDHTLWVQTNITSDVLFYDMTVCLVSLPRVFSCLCDKDMKCSNASSTLKTHLRFNFKLLHFTVTYMNHPSCILPFLHQFSSSRNTWVTMATEEQATSQPLFKNISGDLDDLEATEIESLCVNCEENVSWCERIYLYRSRRRLSSGPYFMKLVVNNKLQ